MATERRKACIKLLDTRHLDIIIQPKLMTSDLLHLVCSHYMLRDKELFGLVFTDETGQHQWLQKERRVLEHDLPRNTETIILQFLVRLYAESITLLDDIKAVELYYLQAQLSISQEQYQCDSQIVFELAAHVLQEQHGNFTDDLTTRNKLKNMPVIPTSTLKEHPSITYCEDQIIERYKQLTSMTRHSAIVNYMSIVENLPVYGVHFYEVKDKAGLPWWLGVSSKGVNVYDHNDRKTARKEFLWKQLENIYFRDRKLSIEVHDVKWAGKSLSRRHTLNGPTSLTVHSWYIATPQLTKSVWSLAVDQHKFYINMKAKMDNARCHCRTMNDVAVELSTSCNVSSTTADVGVRTRNVQVELNEDVKPCKLTEFDMYSSLLERQQLLENQLMNKLFELRQLCLREAELTGVLPADYPLAQGERTPQVRRCVGAMFSLSPKLTSRDCQSKESAELLKLQMEVELQDKIATATLHLARDKSCCRSIRKKRVDSFHKAQDKLKQMELKLCQYRSQQNSSKVKGQSSFEDLSEDSQEFIDSDVERSQSPMAVSEQLKTAGGYVPSAVYTTRTQYRLRTYPTLSTSHIPLVSRCHHASDATCDHCQTESATSSQPVPVDMSRDTCHTNISCHGTTDECLTEGKLVTVTDNSSLPLATVRNTGHCIEISKPFVSSDVLLYSESRRRHRQLSVLNDCLNSHTDPAQL
jgi:hypothetical protein